MTFFLKWQTNKNKSLLKKVVTMQIYIVTVWRDVTYLTQQGLSKVAQHKDQDRNSLNFFRSA